MHLLENWQEEKSSAYLYRIVASKEHDETRKILFLELAEMADNQATLWANELKKTGHRTPKNFRPNTRTRLVGKLIRHLGAKPLRFILSAMKVRGMSIYLSSDPTYPFSTTPSHHEHRHKGLSNAQNLRAAVFGVNDGLISNMSLILGIAAASSNQHFIILTGVAGLLAGACSMAAGEYISVRSQREFFEYQIDLERNELEQYPNEEAAELAIIYRARGLPREEAEKLASVIISNPEKALDTLAREELGLNPTELGSPTGAAISSFLSFGFGALIPLVPFLFGVHYWNIFISMGLTAITLFNIGAALSLFTSRNALIGGTRMLLIGAVAGIFTYLIGHLIGVNL